MPAIKDQILELAKNLPVQELRELIEGLEATLHPPMHDGASAEEISEELERRWQEHLANPNQARPAEAVLSDLRSGYTR